MGWIEAHKHTMQSSHCLLSSPLRPLPELLQYMSFIQSIPHFITRLPFRLLSFAVCSCCPDACSHTFNPSRRPGITVPLLPASFVPHFGRRGTFTTRSFNRLHFRSLHSVRHSFIHSMPFAAPQQQVSLLQPASGFACLRTYASLPS